MLTLRQISLFILVLFHGSMFAAAESKPAVAVEQFEDFVARAMAAYHVPGASIAIVKDGAVAYTKGFGYRDVEHQLPVTPETIFAIGSCTKAFTATALGILVDQGKLDWNAPIRTYLPDFAMYDKEATEQLSIRDCLCHRSGLARYDCLWNRFNSRAGLVAHLRDLKPNAGFREKYQYNNLMYTLAGYVLEMVAGLSWEAFIHQHITQPLGMHNTYFSASVVPSHPNAALAYEFDKTNQSFKNVAYNNLDVIAPAGSIHSDVLDMATWVTMNLKKGIFASNAIVSEQTMNEIHKPQILMAQGEEAQYCFGWVYEKSGDLYIHNGGCTGCSALVLFVPSERIGVVILSNIEEVHDFNLALAKYFNASMTGDNAKIKELEESLTKAAGNDTTTAKQTFQDITPAQAAQFIGTYHNDIFGDFVINANSSTLKGSYIGETLNLGYLDENTLKDNEGWVFRFKRNLSGLPDRFDVDIEKDCTYEFVKV